MRERAIQAHTARPEEDISGRHVGGKNAASEPDQGSQTNSRKRILVWAGGITTALLVAVATAFGMGVGQDLFAIIAGHHSPASAKSPTIGSLAITESHNNYQFVIPIFNSQPNDQQIREISLDVEWNWVDPSCNSGNVGEGYGYSIGQNLTVGKGRTAVAPVTPVSGIGAGSAVLAVGTFMESCPSGDLSGFRDLSLAFRPPALILTGKETTIVYIVLPRDIQAAQNITIPDLFSSSITATMTFQINSGTKMSAHYRSPGS